MSVYEKIRGLLTEAKTEMNSYNRILNEISAAQAKDIEIKHSKAPGRRGLLGLKAPDAAKTEIHSRKVSAANQRIKDRDAISSVERSDAKADRELGRDLSNSRRSQLSQQGTQAKFTKNLYTHKVPGADGKPVKARVKIAASTEINMQGYGRLAEMLGGQAKPSHGFPGHEKRMKGHMERIQKDPRFTEPDQATRDKGKKGASASNKAQAKKKEKG